jgi:hypothetical protein
MDELSDSFFEMVHSITKRYCRISGVNVEIEGYIEIKANIGFQVIWVNQCT